MRAPNGKEITGTLEIVSGVALINDATRLPDGTLDIDYEGYAEIDWDSQKTVMREKHDGHGHPDGDPGTERIFVDEDGGEWPECQIEVDE
jgi:hypothetical protein